MCGNLKAEIELLKKSMAAKNGNTKFLRGINKLNASTHKVMEKVLEYTREERGFQIKKTKKPRK